MSQDWSGCYPHMVFDLSGSGIQQPVCK